MNKLFRVLTLLVFFGLGISCASAANVTSFNPQTVELLPGSFQNVQIVMDEVPTGLAGFNITVSILDPEIAEITAISLPSWAPLSNNGTVPSGSVWITAQDFHNVEAGAKNVSMGTINITGKKAGTTNITLLPKMITADGGSNITPEIRAGNITVLDIESPVINSVSLSNSEPNIGDSIIVTVNATDNVGVSSVTANDIPLIDQGENIWNGSITAFDGTHSVNVSAEDAAGNITWNNSTSYTAVIKPDANFTSNVTSGYAPLYVHFNDSSENATDLNWDFGDGSPASNVSNPIHLFEDPGIYTVNLTATNANGTDLMTVTITALDHESPVIRSVSLSDTELDTGNSINVTVNATDNVGVSGVMANEIPLINQGGNIWNGSIIALEGTHSVNVFAEDAAGNNAWNNTTSYTAVTPILPLANFTSNVTEGYAPLYVQFTDSSENATDLNWDFGDGSPASNASNPVHLFEDPGIYTVNLTATNANGTDLMSATITALDNETPVINSVSLSDTELDTGDSINVTVNATDNVGVSGVMANEIPLVNQGGNIWNGSIIALEGTHSVNVFAEDAAGNIAWNNSTSYTAVTPILPLANFTSNVTEGLAPLTVKFNDSSENATDLNWEFGDESPTSNESNPIHEYESSGTYIVNLTASNVNGTDSMSAIITALDPLSYTIDGNITDVSGRGPGGNVTAAGSVVSYEINVTNNGGIDLNNVSLNISNPQLNLTRSSSSINDDEILDAGEIWTYQINYTVTQADLNNNGTEGNGFIKITATVDCDELNPESYIVQIPIERNPQLSIFKSVISPDKDGDCIVNSAGDKIPYRIVVMNEGNVDLKNVTVNDSKISLTKPTGDNNESGILNVGETWEYIVVYSLTSDDIKNGDYIENNANVTCDELSEKNSSVITPIDKRTDLSIYKSLRGIDEAGDKKVNKAGDIINYRIAVKNNGNVELTGVSVSDPLVTLTKVTGNNNDTVLSSGELWEYTGNYTVTQEDIGSNGNGSGLINNTAIVSCNELNERSSTIVLPIIRIPSVVVTPETNISVVPLEANFSTNTTSGNAPLVIEFTDLSQNVDSRSWDFNNDGTPDSDKEKIVYTYATPGTYTAKLTVTKANETASKTATINVTKAPTNNGESGGKSSHSSGGSGRSGGSIGPVVSSTVTSTGKSNATGNATVTQAQNNTPIEQNNENTVVDVEQTPVQTNNTSTPAKESKKTPAFGIISGIICLSAVFLYKRR